MTWLLRAGGVGGYVTFAFGLVTLLNAALLAARPNHRRRAIYQAMARATILSAVGSTAVGVLFTIQYVHAEGSQVAAAEAAQVLLLGCSESMASLVLGFVPASLAAMLEAIAARREA